jgi:hypothetical protein
MTDGLVHIAARFGEEHGHKPVAFTLCYMPLDTWVDQDSITDESATCLACIVRHGNGRDPYRVNEWEFCNVRRRDA